MNTFIFTIFIIAFGLFISFFLFLVYIGNLRNKEKLNCALKYLENEKHKTLKNVNCSVFRTISIKDNNYQFGNCDLFIGFDYLLICPFNTFPMRELKIPILLTNNQNIINHVPCEIRTFNIKRVSSLSQQKTIFFSENDVSVEFESERLLKSEITITFNYLTKENAEILTDLKNWC